MSGYSAPSISLDYVVSSPVTNTQSEAQSSGPSPSAPELGYQPTAWSKRSGAMIFGFVALLVAGMVISGLYRTSKRDDVFTEADKALTKGLSVLPFTARLPTPVPEGTRLVRVLMQEPDRRRGPSIYAIETTYTNIKSATQDGAEYVRVWQTNDVYLRKQVLDPLGDRLDPKVLNNNTWYRRSGESLDRDAGVSYSTRFGDGITMVVSGPNEALVLKSISTLTNVK